MNIDWSALLIVALVSIVAASVTVTLFSMGIRLFAVPPAGEGEPLAAPRDDETDEVSGPTRPPLATAAGIACFVLSGIVVLIGVYLIVPALHGG